MLLYICIVASLYDCLDVAGRHAIGLCSAEMTRAVHSVWKLFVFTTCV